MWTQLFEGMVRIVVFTVYWAVILIPVWVPLIVGGWWLKDQIEKRNNAAANNRAVNMLETERRLANNRRDKEYGKLWER